jgi:4-aminobutyrate--pyruvate transaminase
MPYPVVALVPKPAEKRPMPPLDVAQQSDVASLVPPYTELAGFCDTGPTIIVRGEGIRIFDNQGRELIEGMAGLWCTALGCGNAALIEAAA